MSLDVVLIDEDVSSRASLGEVLRAAGHTVREVNDTNAAIGTLEKSQPDVVVGDVRTGQGLGFVRWAHTRWPEVDFIVTTQAADVEEAVAAMKLGVLDYVVKPVVPERIVELLEQTCLPRALWRSLQHATAAGAGHLTATQMVGRSAAMAKVLAMVETVSASTGAVLVTGDSGTGKELVARLLHERSPRKDGPFVVVNCGLLPEGLIEAELFGHERGAFTGAVRRREGRFEAAHGGTIFLDEIAELPPNAQGKLLRVLQEGTFEPLGASKTVRVDVRVVSATHRDLRERVREGRFRGDLLFRINVFEVDVPPLRTRMDDLPLLIHHFLSRLVPPPQPLPSVTRAAWRAFAEYDYPGNVRELAHTVEHAYILSGGGEIDVHHLPPALLGTDDDLDAELAGLTLPSLHSAIRRFEREYISRAVRVTGGRRGRAAELLGISRKSLWEKLRGDNPLRAPDRDLDGPPGG